MKAIKTIITVSAIIMLLFTAISSILLPVEFFAGRLTIDYANQLLTVRTSIIFLCATITLSSILKFKTKKHLFFISICCLLLGIVLIVLFSLLLIPSTIESCMNESISSAVISALILSICAAVSGLFSGFGLAIILPKQYVSQNNHANERPVSKTAAALFAFFFGNLGVHRYYLGYKKEGAAQTCGYFAFISALIIYLPHMLLGWLPQFVDLLPFLILPLYSIATSIWSFVDFIQILTGTLQPTNGRFYPTTTIQTAPSSNITDTLEKLAKLHDQGILTDEEFQQKKTDLLSKL